MKGKCISCGRRKPVRKTESGGTICRGCQLHADLRGADLRGADLRGADLRDSDLSYSDLSGADLRGSNLSGALVVPACPSPPDDGAA